mmetsp:Transcript_9811/g.20634  ORF Transcript_9811/g.20634 Transcript_9811/m.20634 type:complete len:342 (-) Transcript_9811:339-1364(-)
MVRALWVCQQTSANECGGGCASMETGREDETLLRARRKSLDAEIRGLVKVFAGTGVLAVVLLVLMVVLRGKFKEAPLQITTLDDFIKAAAMQESVIYGAGGVEPCKVVVYLIRHAEKGTRKRSLSDRGRDRANWLPNLFARNTTREAKSLRPIRAIFARRPERHKFVLRSVQTVQPLAEELGLSVIQRYGVRNQAAFARHLLAHEIAPRAADHCGRAILVCWKHSAMVDLQRQLGCDPNIVSRRVGVSGSGEDSLPRSGNECVPFVWKGHDFDSLVTLEYEFQTAGREEFVERYLLKARSYVKSMFDTSSKAARREESTLLWRLTLRHGRQNFHPRRVSKT